MNAGRFLTATGLGAVVLFAVGGLIWGVAFANAYPPTPVDREPMALWLIFVSQLPIAAALVVIIGRTSGGPNVGRGVLLGAVIGFCVQLHLAFFFAATTTLPISMMTYLDPFLSVLWGGIGGASVGWWLGRSPGARRAEITS